MPVYLDHNATSPSLPEHLSALFARLQSVAGNPSSPHAAGRAASVALTDARKQVAASLGVDAGEVVFVSGGSEANNLATTGVLHATGKNMSELHAITSAIEHPCVLEPLVFLRDKYGLQLTILPVDKHGRISERSLVEAIRTNTVLVAIMVANNETGAIQPVFPFAEWLHTARWFKARAGQHWRESQQATWPDWARVLQENVTQEQLQHLHFHVDAVQAYGKLPSSDWWSAGYDSASVCAHKLGGLAGVGALILRRGRKFQPLILGGAQERSRRAGTENLAGVLSLAAVAQKIRSPEWWTEVESLIRRRETLAAALKEFTGVTLNTPSEAVLPNTVNFSVDGTRRRGEDVLLELDMRGFYASSGSACSSGANRPSHVLMAQLDDAVLARNAVRISLATSTTDGEIDALLGALREILSDR
ncbi:MAG: hypothetical protein RLZZ488_107 [Pseudomonadota bacterium]